jgi:hypothetical protein
MRARILAPLLAAALAQWVAGSPALGQEPTSILHVTVRTAGSDAPLVRAQVSVEGLGIGGVTDHRGSLRLPGIPGGTQTIVVRSVGFQTQRQEVRVAGAAVYPVAFAMMLRAVELPEVRARARSGVRRLANAGFYDRQAQGLGRFITREDIDARRARMLSDMLRTVPGVHLSGTRSSDSHASMRRSLMPNRRCPIQYYMDGIPAHALNIDDIPARDVEGVEIYSGVSQIPPQFNRRTAMCGVIAIWTRVD